jgi:calcineurin-like phosphoesterase family protein
MRTFFTADFHLGHANILKYQEDTRRKSYGAHFATISEHDEYLVTQWNATVAPDDLVYCLGDMSYKQTCLEAYMPRMHGRKILVVGNHDPFFKRMTELSLKTHMQNEMREAARQAGFESVHLQLDIEIPGVGATRLNHFPYEPVNKEGVAEYNLRFLNHRPRRGKEKLLLCGHVHSDFRTNREPGHPPAINVGIDQWAMRPVSETEIASLYNELQEK